MEKFFGRQEKPKFDEMSSEEKIRLAYIEEREDLFETQVFHVENKEDKKPEHNVLVIGRDPGIANALVPVMRELQSSGDVGMDIITDGRAQDIFNKQFKTSNITPTEGPLAADAVMPQPDVIVLAPSQERGLDAYASATFVETLEEDQEALEVKKAVPKVLVEDVYGSALPFLELLQERNLPMPDSICVLDEGAKHIIVEKFPDLERRIEVTGQPIFDAISEEDTEAIARDVRQRLGIDAEKKIITYMSTIDEPAKIKEMAEALQHVMNKDMVLVFRRHPRDNTPYEEFKQLFEAVGIEVVDSDEITTAEMNAASDVVMTTWSTEGMTAMYRGKPTIHYIDERYRVEDSVELPYVPVRLGATVGASSPEEIAQALPDLLDPESQLYQDLQEHMAEHYKADGKNAARVAAVVRKHFGTN